MTQKTLFDIDVSTGFYGQPLARKTDPETSQIAAVDAASKASKLHQTIAGWLAMQPEPLTAREIAEGCKRECRLDCEIETIRKRVGETVGVDFGGLLVRSFPSRKCTVTGKLAECFIVGGKKDG